MQHTFGTLLCLNFTTTRSLCDILRTKVFSLSNLGCGIQEFDSSEIHTDFYSRVVTIAIILIQLR